MIPNKPPSVKNIDLGSGREAESDAFRTILTLAETDVPKLPEPLFLQHIFPILTDTSGEANVEAWLMIAGTLNRAIDVVDGADNVLFRVPPLQRSVTTRDTRDGNHPLGQIIADAEARMMQSPRAGTRYLNQRLNERVPHEKIDLEPIRLLNVIFKRYNHPLIKIGDEVPMAEIPMAEDEVASKPLFSEKLDDL